MWCIAKDPVELNCSKHTSHTFWWVSDCVTELALVGFGDGADGVADEADGEGEAGLVRQAVDWEVFVGNLEESTVA